MTKFFRRIRQRLLEQKRFIRYLFYASGEIILVVAGILIALQVNNWNEQRKDGLQEISLLKEMRQNLEGDLSDCRYNVQRNQQLRSGNTAVLRHLEERTPFHDSGFNSMRLYKTQIMIDEMNAEISSMGGLARDHKGGSEE